MKILVTGTPGVGKTTLSRRIAGELGIRHIDVSEYIKANELYDAYDEELETHLFDEEKIGVHLAVETEGLGSFVIDTHSPGVAGDIDFDYIFHLRCDIAVLAERLESRRYPEAKVSENIECEIFDIVGEELERCFVQSSVLVGGPSTEGEEAGLGTEDVLAMLKTAISGPGTDAG